jgi:hypothetical protein
VTGNNDRKGKGACVHCTITTYVSSHPACDAQQAKVDALAEKCGQLASADEQRAAAASIKSLHDGVWKGFDAAAAHRRELADAAAGQAAALKGHVDASVSAAAAPAQAARDAAQEALAALRPIDAKVAALHDDRQAHEARAARHAEALAEVAQVARDSHAVAAKSDELSQHGQERGQQHKELLAAVDALREALAARTAAGSAGTTAELGRLGGGLQELSDRVDALAQVGLFHAPHPSSSFSFPLLLLAPL